nr:ABC transporter ATP-binding protein [uncultured Lachnoanaerobaculum sp.]
MNSLSTNNLTIAYNKKIIINNLEIVIPERKITSIIGPNGCGKSTLLKAVGRILKPERGSVYLDGIDIYTLNTKEVAKKMSILPQSPKAPSGITVGELVSYGRFPHQHGLKKLTVEDKKIIQWAMDITKLSEYEVTLVDNLSGGQRQRVWIAMALAQQTDIILLDEPTTYLDLAYQLEILELLYRLNKEQGCTIAMVLHDLNLASRFSDYIIAMRSGKIIEYGTLDEVICEDVLKKTFNINADIIKDSTSKKPICVSYDLIRE